MEVLGRKDISNSWLGGVKFGYEADHLKQSREPTEPHPVKQ